MLRHSTCSFLICLAIVATADFQQAFADDAPAADTDERPNVVIVITDDQGYGDLSCHGNPVLKTPNIDQLYGESIRLTDYHVSPTCSPSRSAFLTGHWTNRTGVWHTVMGRSMLRENEVCVADMFKSGGYATGMFGKWHLGDNYPFRPTDRGFTEVLCHGGGGVGQTPDYWDNAYFDDTYWHNNEPTPVEGYCTDVFFEYATSFIKQSKEAGKPFLAYISTNAPHGPLLCPTKYSRPYGDIREKNFFGMIANIDENVGRMRTFLADEGLAENTIFIFTTDNGTAGGAKVFDAGMRGRKGSEYDGGHRVPFFMHWPAKGLTAGRDEELLTGHVDVVPTLLDLCGVDAPEDLKFDGLSLRPMIDELSDSDADTEWPDRMLITDSQRIKDPAKWRKSSVMSTGWRLINGTELYNMTADPAQETNIAELHPERVKAMREFYDQWWAELEPTFDQDTRIYIGHEMENPSRLTSHDWITTGLPPWSQSHIRQATNGDEATGFWNVKICEPGTYQFALHRWPAGSGGALDAPMAPGENVPGARPPRVIPGKAIAPVKAKLMIAGKEVEQAIEPGAMNVTFELELEPQDAQLECQLIEEDGTIYGAYFVYVNRK